MTPLAVGVEGESVAESASGSGGDEEFGAVTLAVVLAWSVSSWSSSSSFSELAMDLASQDIVKWWMIPSPKSQASASIPS